MIPVISFLSYDIPIYGLCWFLGIAVSGIIAVCFSKRAKVEGYDVVYSAVFSLIGGTIGAKLLFVAVSLKTIIEQSIPLESLLKGGFVFYGGLIGGCLGLFIYAKAFKMRFLPLCDLYALALPIGHAIGRVGCFVSGCCYGREYDGILSVTYSQTLGNTPLGVPLFPLQLVEALTLLLLFVAILIVFLLQYKRGIPTVIYLFAYPFIRFVLEFFRGDLERGSVFGLSTSQIISAFVFFCAIAVVLKLKKATAE